jgi:hypothetical protein
MTNNDNDYNKVIGLDLGHAETSLAIVDVRNAKAEPEMLMVNNEKSQPTAIAYNSKKGKLIGQSAIGSSDSDLRISFKRMPQDFSDINSPDLKPLKDFAEGVYERLVIERRINPKDNTRFYVGCPSGWSDITRKIYEELLRQSKIPDLVVVPESRAALTHVYERSGLTKNDLKGTVIVIDLGSSTADFTLIWEKRQQGVDFGLDLGASLIDKAILEYALSMHPQRSEIEKVFLEMPNYLHRCEYLCRKIKEEYFTHPDAYEGKNCVFVGRVNIQNLYTFQPMISQRVMTGILNQPMIKISDRTHSILSWPDAFEYELKKLKLLLYENRIDPTRIIVTGGASRMGFVTEKLALHFSDLFIMDSEPEYCIARGLARVGRIDHQSQKFKGEVDLFLKNDFGQIIKESLPSLINLIAQNLTIGIISDIIEPALINWRSGKIKTLNDLKLEIESASKVWVEQDACKNRVEKSIFAWSEQIQGRIADETIPICQKYGLAQKGLSNFNVLIHPNMNGFVGIININASIGWAISVAVVIALQMSLTGFLLGILLAFLFPVWGAGAAKKLQEGEVPVSMRGWILNNDKLRKTIEDIKPKLLMEIETNLKNREDILTSLTSESQKVLTTSVNRLADDLRYLIA